MQIFRITYTHHFLFSKCQNHYFACISTHTEFVWHTQDSPELPHECRSSERCMLSRCAHMESVWHIYLSAIYVPQVQHRINWQFNSKCAQARWKVACCLICCRKSGIWKTNKNLKPLKREEDLLFSKTSFQILFFQLETKE